jgi:hypothetical protein
VDNDAVYAIPLLLCEREEQGREKEGSNYKTFHGMEFYPLPTLP